MADQPVLQQEAPSAPWPGRKYSKRDRIEMSRARQALLRAKRRRHRRVLRVVIARRTLAIGAVTALAILVQGCLAVDGGLQLHLSYGLNQGPGSIIRVRQGRIPDDLRDRAIRLGVQGMDTLTRIICRDRGASPIWAPPPAPKPS